MSLHDRLKKLFSGSFVQDVAKLSLGTLAGRLITIAAMPLLTRLYSPDDFTLLAAYVAIVSTIAVAACLRFEIAIPLADNDEEAKYLLILSFLALVAVTLVVLVVVWVLPQQMKGWTKQTVLESYIWMIPIGIAALGFYSIMQFWVTRARRFAQIAQTRITQAFVGVSVSLSFGWLGCGPLGLLIGNILNTSAGGLRLACWSVKHEAKQFSSLTLSGLKNTMRRYKRYPVYSTPESFFNTAGIHLPILVVAAYGGAEAGFLLLAMQIMAAPMGLLGGSISQVYVSRAPQSLKDGQLDIFTRKIILRLFKVGVVPFLFIGILSPWLVPNVFGSNWARTGEIICWMMPWMLLQLVVSPVSMALHVTSNQAKAMMLQAFGVVFRLVVVLLVASLIPLYIVEAYAVSGAFFYAIYLDAVLRVVQKTRCNQS